MHLKYIIDVYISDDKNIIDVAEKMDEIIAPSLDNLDRNCEVTIIDDEGNIYFE